MKAKETGQNISFFSFPMGKSAKAKRRRSLWFERFDAKVLSLHKILKYAVDTLCLEMQLVTQAPLTIYSNNQHGV